MPSLPLFSPRLWLSALAALAAAFMLGACSSPTDTPEGVAKAFLHKAYAGDADAALKLVYLPPDGSKPGATEMAQGKVRAAVAQAQSQAEKYGGFQGVEVISSEINPTDPNRARTVLKVQFKNKEAQENIRSIRVDKKWMVHMF